MRAITNIIKGKSFASLAGNGIGALLGLVTFALLARILNKADFGMWILFLTIYGLFDTLRIGMILNALVKNLAKCTSPEEEHETIGSAMYITSIITAIFLVIILATYIICYQFNFLTNYIGYFKWYAIIALLTLPNNFATWVLNAKLNIISMSLIRAFTQILFIIGILFIVKESNNIESLFISYGISHLIISIFCILFGISGIQYVFKNTKKIVKNIFDFGKYSMGTLLGANLLRSSDTFIINNLLGSVLVAIYNVPMRIIELVEMPLRSFAITALPQFAHLFASGKKQILKSEFERRSGAIFFILLPLSIFCLIFAESMVVWLGGAKYEDSAILLRLFAIYTAILPLDKFSGILLDVIDKPQINFLKVTLMLTVNVVGDIIAISYFGTLQSVAIVSSLTFLTGFLFGFFMIKKHIDISLTNVFVYGFNDVFSKTKHIINFQ